MKFFGDIPLSEALRMSPDADAILRESAYNVAVARVKMIDRMLIAAIERIEGRVPTNDEIRQHAIHAIFPSGREEWKWRGQIILEANGLTFWCNKADAP